MTWVLFTAWLGLGAFMAPKIDDRPLGAWDQVGAVSYLFVVNHTPDTIPVGAIARAVDHTIRLMGLVMPKDSMRFLIPYADAEVILLVGSYWVEIDNSRTGEHRIEIIPQPPKLRSEGG